MPWTDLQGELAEMFSDLSSPDPTLQFKYVAHFKEKLRAYRQEYDSRSHARKRRDAYFKAFYAAHYARSKKQRQAYYARPDVRARQTKHERVRRHRQRCILWFVRALAGIQVRLGRPKTPELTYADLARASSRACARSKPRGS